jgi:ketosteroid isomerase-like protein
LATGKETRTGEEIEAAARRPEERNFGAAATSRAFARALLAGDPGAAASQLAVDVRLLSADGTELCGREAARTLLAQITTSGHELEIRAGRCVEAGGVALCTQYWRRSAPGPGVGFESRSVARLVVVRSAERWRIAIVSPWE